MLHHSVVPSPHHSGVLVFLYHILPAAPLRRCALLLPRADADLALTGRCALLGFCRLHGLALGEVREGAARFWGTPLA